MKEVLITGSSGRLGGKLVKVLLDTTDFNVVAVAASEEKYKKMKEREHISTTNKLRFLSNDELISSRGSLNGLYGTIHLAFSRRNQPPQQIADSLNFSTCIFKKLATSDVKKVINVSSQGVYGSTNEIRTESTLVAPDNHYTMAKYASEVIFNNFFCESQVKYFTNLRLDLVSQNNNLITTLCKQATEGHILLRGGEQIFSFIDENDAVSAMAVLILNDKYWENVYNVGWNCQRYTLIEIAKLVVKAAEDCGYIKPDIVLDKQEIKLWAGMDSSRFTELTGWTPKITLFETIIEIIKNM